MAFKVTKRIIRHYLGCQDRDVVFGTPAEAVLSAIRDHRLDLIRELVELESRDDATIDKLVEGALPKSITGRDFVIALRVFACLDRKQ